MLLLLLATALVVAQGFVAPLNFRSSVFYSYAITGVASGSENPGYWPDNEHGSGNGPQLLAGAGAADVCFVSGLQGWAVAVTRVNCTLGNWCWHTYGFASSGGGKDQSAMILCIEWWSRPAALPAPTFVDVVMEGGVTDATFAASDGALFCGLAGYHSTGQGNTGCVAYMGSDGRWRFESGAFMLECRFRCVFSPHLAHTQSLRQNSLPYSNGALQHIPDNVNDASVCVMTGVSNNDNYNNFGRRCEIGPDSKDPDDTGWKYYKTNYNDVICMFACLWIAPVTPAPTAQPSVVPSEAPSAAPTRTPSMAPAAAPTTTTTTKATATTTKATATTTKTPASTAAQMPSDAAGDSVATSLLIGILCFLAACLGVFVLSMMLLKYRSANKWLQQASFGTHSLQSLRSASRRSSRSTRASRTSRALTSDADASFGAGAGAASRSPLSYGGIGFRHSQYRPYAPAPVVAYESCRSGASGRASAYVSTSYWNWDPSNVADCGYLEK